MTRASLALPLDLPAEQTLYAKIPQKNPGTCQFCGGPESGDKPFVAVLTYIDRTSRHFIHAGQCHQQHSDRIRSEREQHYREKGRTA